MTPSKLNWEFSDVQPIFAKNTISLQYAKIFVDICIMTNYNGNLLPADHLLFPVSNRAFRYGDGLFETIRVVNNEIPYWKLHMERLQKGIKILGLEKAPSAQRLKKECKKLLETLPNARLRIMLFRTGGGNYAPQSDKTDFVIQAEALNSDTYHLNKEGLHLEIFSTIQVPPDQPLNNIKTNNALPYILAARHAREVSCDDCLLLNTAGRIIEASSSNIFIVKDAEIHTPSLGEGCLDGVMRKVVIGLCEKNKWQVHVSKIDIAVLASAEQVFLTNAISGVRWVRRIGDMEFEENGVAEEVVQELN